MTMDRTACCRGWCGTQMRLYKSTVGTGKMTMKNFRSGSFGKDMIAFGKKSFMC